MVAPAEDRQPHHHALEPVPIIIRSCCFYRKSTSLTDLPPPKPNGIRVYAMALQKHSESAKLFCFVGYAKNAYIGST